MKILDKLYIDGVLQLCEKRKEYYRIDLEPANNEDIDAVEKKWDIGIPEEYRYFLTKWGGVYDEWLERRLLNIEEVDKLCSKIYSNPNVPHILVPVLWYDNNTVDCINLSVGSIVKYETPSYPHGTIEDDLTSELSISKDLKSPLSVSESFMELIGLFNEGFWYKKKDLIKYLDQEKEIPYTLAEIYKTEGNNQKAITYFKKAIRQGHIESIKLLGDIYFEDNSIDAAVNYYSSAIEKGCNDAIPCLIKCHLKLNDAESALKVSEFNQNANIELVVDWYVNGSATGTLSGKDKEEAIKLFELYADRSVSLISSFGKLIGDWYYENGNVEIAAKWYEKEAGDISCLILGDIYLKKGDQNSAITWYDKSQTLDAFEKLGDLYLSKGEENAALTYYEKLVFGTDCPCGSRFGKYAFLKGKICFDNGDFAEGVNYYKGAAKYGIVDAYLVIAKYYFEHYNIKDALDFYKEAESAGNKEAGQFLYEFNSKHKEDVEKISALETEFANGSMDAGLKLAEIYTLLGGKYSALKLYRKIAKKGNSEGQYQLSLTYIESGDYLSAISWLLSASQNGNQKASAQLKSLLLKLQDESEQNNVNAQATLAYIYTKGICCTASEEIAKKWYDRALENDNENKIIDRLEKMLNINGESDDKPVQSLESKPDETNKEKASQLTPNEDKFLSEKDIEAAYSEYKQEYKSTKDINILYQLYHVSTTKSHVKDTIDFLAKAADKEPDNSRLYLLIGNLSIVYDVIDYAIENLQKALTLGLDENCVHLNLGIAYYLNKEYDKAIESLNRCRCDEKYGALSLLYRGKVNEHMGHNDLALEDYKKCAEIPLERNLYVESAEAMFCLSNIEDCKELLKSAVISTKESNINYKHKVCKDIASLYAKLGENELASQYLELSKKYGEFQELCSFNPFENDYKELDALNCYNKLVDAIQSTNQARRQNCYSLDNSYLKDIVSDALHAVENAHFSIKQKIYWEVASLCAEKYEVENVEKYLHLALECGLDPSSKLSGNYENAVNEKDNVKLLAESLLNKKMKILLQGKFEDNVGWIIFEYGNMMITRELATDIESENIFSRDENYGYLIITGKQNDKEGKTQRYNFSRGINNLFVQDIPEDNVIKSIFAGISVGTLVIDSDVKIKELNRLPRNFQNYRVKDENKLYCSQDGLLLTKDGTSLISCPYYHSHDCSIPEGVKTIEKEAFKYCSEVRSIIIPDTVVSIGKSAFCGCCHIDSISIPEGVTSIENETFKDCYNLKSITIPEGVKSIKAKAFKGCYNLKSILIPNSVVSIENEAFSGCTRLEKIEILNSSISVGKNAFKGCKNEHPEYFNK